MNEIKLLYICDREACENCGDYCEHTSDINHGVNRDSLEGRKFEYHSCCFKDYEVGLFELEEEKTDSFVKDPTGELKFMREKIMLHIDRLQCSDNNYEHLMGDWIEIYIKELEKQLREAKEEKKDE